MPLRHKRIWAHAKLNLFLSIGEREDRLHAIDTIIQSISLADVIDFIATDRPGFRVDIVEGSVAGGDTLIQRALKVMAEHLHCHAGMAVMVHKRIPEGAGLGGGSADAAAALVAANDLWNLNLPPDQLRFLSRDIGSDVGYFLVGGTCRVTGTGNVVHKLEPLPRYYAVVCYPGFPVSSADAYRWWDEEGTHLAVGADEAAKRLRAGEKADATTNAFYPILARLFPIVAELVEELEKAGAFWTGVTGSGSAVYGLFPERESALAAGAKIRRTERCDVYISRFVESAIEERTE